MRALPLIGALLLSTPACDACDSTEARVPFGIDAGEAPSADLPPTPGREPFQGSEGQTLPEGTTRLEVEGAPLEAASGALHSILPLDLDGDGDRDVLTTILDEGAVTLAHARRDGASFAPLRTLATEEAQEDCVLSSTELRTVAPEYAMAIVDRSCGGEAARSVWIVSVEAEPRVREQVGLLPALGRTAGEVSIAFRSVDQDDDGHADMVLDVSVTPPEDTEPATVSIAWLDRPGGLARDTNEPEATLLGLSRQAQASLSRDAGAALLTARRALALHAALCREAGAPRVRFGDAPGLTCRTSPGAGAAAAVAAAALARTGRVFEALDAARRLEDEGYRVGGRARRNAEQALSEMPTPEGLMRREGPEVHLGARPPTHLSALGFLDENRLLVRAEPTVVLDLASLDASPAPVASSAAVVDPSGNLALASVGRTCAGHVLRIVRAADVVAGVVAGRPVSEPLLEARAAPAGASCPELPAAAREDDGGWQVVGWAPQGVVAVRRDEARLVPLTVDGASAGRPTILDEHTPPPVPIPAGAMSADGRTYAIATPYGIAVQSLGPPRRTTLLRPQGWAGDGATNVAVSPSGDQVAYLRGNQVIVVTRP